MDWKRLERNAVHWMWQQAKCGFVQKGTEKQSLHCGASNATYLLCDVPNSLSSYLPINKPLLLQQIFSCYGAGICMGMLGIGDFGMLGPLTDVAGNRYFV